MKFAVISLIPVLLLAGCCEKAKPLSRQFFLEETGSIEYGDLTDQNHAGLAYDAYDFQVVPLDTVTVAIEAEGFDPMLKLAEVSTGAVLAEWDSQYSEEDRLTYVIAGGGVCQARVYALEHGTGSYTVSVTVAGR